MTRRIVGLVAALVLPAAVGGMVCGERAASADDGPTSASVVLSRVHLESGQDVMVDQRTFTATVSSTADLRSHSVVTVTWSGAHPTGGIVADPNSGDAVHQEYPVVVLECRGRADAAPDAPDRIDPTTCWTATAAERFEDSFNTSFPPWRVDRWASPAERAALVGQPGVRPPACFAQPSPAERWVPFVAVDGTNYPGGSGGCGGQAPESANVGGLNLPSNTTYGATRADGTGTARFDVWTAEDNASLGCSQSVACALVVVPIEGVSCDTAAAGVGDADRPAPDIAADVDALCTADGAYEAGQLANASIDADEAVSGSLWWSASNWRNRLVFPLAFAPPANVCDVVNNAGELDLYGSELMTQAMLQWSPRFCLDTALFKLKHVQTPEPQARRLLGSGAVAVLTSDVAGPSPVAVLDAPVALTGFAIAFTVDDAAGHEMAELRLTPRLLAKLLTMSYPAIVGVQTEYAALSRNPLNITLDPEFIALNPDVTDGVPASESAATLLALSSDSDVTAALTAYIDADPAASAWLDGTPDPWGMVVNPSYRGIDLPTSSWPLLDTFEPTRLYQSAVNDCLYNEPVPYLPLVAAPLARLASIALHMQFSLANSQTTCQAVIPGSNLGEKLVAVGRQTVGYRFMLGVTSLGDAARYGLRVASLQTSVSPEAADAFTSTDGRTFVTATETTLRSAAALMVTDAAGQGMTVPYDVLRTSAGAAAYPGTMVVYAQVPAAGLAIDDLQRVIAFLDFAAGQGQTPGPSVGQLPPGFVPLGTDTALTALAQRTAAVVAALRAQLPVPTTTTVVPATTRPPTTSKPASTTAPAVVSSTAPPSPTTEANAPLPAATTTVPDPTTSTTAAAFIDTSRAGVDPLPRYRGHAPTTATPTSASAGRVLPALLTIALVAGSGAFLARILARRRVVRAAPVPP